jgi:thiamine transporter
MEPFIFHPVQVFLDYPLAYALVGVSGAFAPLLRRYAESKKVGLVLGTIAVASCAGVLDRFVSHVISGIVFFGANTPEGQNVLWYSVVYNASYLLPSFVVTLPVVMLTIPLLYATLESDRG